MGGKGGGVRERWLNVTFSFTLRLYLHLHTLDSTGVLGCFGRAHGRVRMVGFHWSSCTERPLVCISLQIVGALTTLVHHPAGLCRTCVHLQSASTHTLSNQTSRKNLNNITSWYLERTDERTDETTDERGLRREGLEP